MIVALLLFWFLSGYYARGPKTQRKSRQRAILAELAKGERSLAQLARVLGPTNWLWLELLHLRSQGLVEQSSAEWFDASRPLEEQIMVRRAPEVQKPTAF